MTDWEAGRDERTARRSAAITRGGSPLMPSHSQGAERRPERRAGRTGSRWLLRALVIGGLAGSAWLLTGSAAHAADRGGEPFGSVPHVAEAGYEPTVGELLEAAVQPPEPAPENDRRVATPSPHTSGGTADERTPPRPAETAPGPTAEQTPARQAGNQPRFQHRHLPAARPAPVPLRDDVPGDDGPLSRRNDAEDPTVSPD